ncbi:MAG: TolB family protein [Thermoleophilia bacterium]
MTVFSFMVASRLRSFILFSLASFLFLAVLTITGAINYLATGQDGYILYDASPGVSMRVSTDAYGNQGLGGTSGYDIEFMAISQDGQNIAFESEFTNLVSGDTNGNWDVFVKDSATGSTRRVSTDSNGNQANGLSGWPSMTPDGNLVAFSSNASNLVYGDTNQSCGMFGCDVGWGYDIFVKNLQTGSISRESTNSSGGQVNYQSSQWPSISADGQFVVFQSNAQYLAGNDLNYYSCSYGSNCIDIFVKNRVSGLTTLVSSNASETGSSNKESLYPHISNNGQYVMFSSNSTDLVNPSTTGTNHVYVRNIQAGTNELVSTNTLGVPGNNNSTSYGGSISNDGRYVVFSSISTNLIPGVPNDISQIYLKDRLTGNIRLISADINGAVGNDTSMGGSIAANGRYVAFESKASNLVPGDSVNCPRLCPPGGCTESLPLNSCEDIFVKDLQSNKIVLVSTNAEGIQGSGSGSASSKNASISADGKSVTFWSRAKNLVPVDTNGKADVFLARVPSCGVKPRLTLARDHIYWSSYADYTARQLTVDFRISNTGESVAAKVKLVSTINSSEVSSSSLPLDDSDIEPGASRVARIKYFIPNGVSQFSTRITASAADGCMNIFSYP